MPIDEILFEAEEHMEKAIDHLKHEFRGLRTGRATTALLDDFWRRLAFTPTFEQELPSA